MDNIESVAQWLIVVLTAIGGFRQYILKPYWDSRDRERKWAEEIEKMREDKTKERDRRFEELEKAKESRQMEREKRVEEKYSQLASTMKQLTDAVYLIRNERQQDMADKARFDERLGTAEDNIDGLWKAQDKMSERIDRMGDNHEK